MTDYYRRSGAQLNATEFFQRRLYVLDEEVKALALELRKQDRTLSAGDALDQAIEMLPHRRDEYQTTQNRTLPEAVSKLAAFRATAAKLLGRVEALSRNK